MRSALEYAALLGSLCLPTASSRVVSRATKTVLPSNSFSSASLFNQYWKDFYPWGNTHNGGAKMDAGHIQVDYSQNKVVLTATPTSGLGSTTSGGQTIPLHYLSGTIYATQTFTVQQGGGYDFSADFIAPTTKGTWPAFWLTATSGWPPEIDIAEWKGDGKISFNTFNTSSVVKAVDVNYPSPGSTHSVKAEIRDENGSDVVTKFYLDGALVTTQYADNYVGKGLWLVIDYQMEGSSGSPGPTTTTTYTISNVEVISYNP